jgi:hypothetical protein
MDDFSKDEWKEIALGLNLLSSNRNLYLIDDSNIKYRDDNEKYLKMDNELIRKIKNKIDELKVVEEE